MRHKEGVERPHYGGVVGLPINLAVIKGIYGGLDGFRVLVGDAKIVALAAAAPASLDGTEA